LEPRAEIPVGHGQTRRAWVVSAELGYSRAIAGALVFSKEAPELLFGMSRCLTRLGALPEKLVWDREGAIHAGGGRPTDAFDRFCGELRVGWLILEPRDPQAKGALERSHRFLRTSFEPGRSVAHARPRQALGFRFAATTARGSSCAFSAAAAAPPGCVAWPTPAATRSRCAPPPARAATACN
jgi:hypothetical protein